MADEIVIEPESPLHDDSVVLLEMLGAELSGLYPDEVEWTPFAPSQLMGPGKAFVIARLDGRPVGCGSIRPHERGVAEVKRMFVKAEARGKGVGRRILEKLEILAVELGYSRLRLETGMRQPAAIGLYESYGFTRVECYGAFVTNPMSVCFEKRLS